MRRGSILSYQITANEDTSGGNRGGSAGRTQNTVDVMRRERKSKRRGEGSRDRHRCGENKRGNMSGLLPRFPFQREWSFEYECHFYFSFSL